jgi:transcription antitermination factor NusG
MLDPALLPEVVSESTPWYAVKVRTRAEDTVRTLLAGKGYVALLPTYLECRQYSDRVKKIDAPLFPGYLFCRLDVNRRLPVLVTPGVEYLVGFGGIPQPIPASEIVAIEAVMNSGLSAQPWPFLRSGHRVRIEMGALRGVEGTLVRTQGADRLVLSVELLQRSISVAIDRSWVRPAPAHPAALHPRSAIE